MNPMLHIRKRVLAVTQAEMAQIAAVGQATVSRWENRSGAPSRIELERIRSEALRRGVAWDDSWFFEAPVEAAE